MVSNILIIKTLNPNTCGFFSCCTQIFQKLCEYISKTKKYPDWYDSRELFVFYKNSIVSDIPCGIFDMNSVNNKKMKLSNTNPYFNISFQYSAFSSLKFNNIKPMIDTYFKPNNKVMEIKSKLEEKYNIDYDNTVALYYRGTDKHTETKLGTKEVFEQKLLSILEDNNNLKILIQSDSQQFIDYYKEKYPGVIFIDENLTSYKGDGIHKEVKNTELNYEKMFYLLATFLIISKCKYYICNSSNCSLWISIYRGHGNNIYQYLNGEWV